jgi:hypothetical protein
MLTLLKNGKTLIAGPVQDQAALHGVLAKIRNLGLPLLPAVCVDCKGETEKMGAVYLSRIALELERDLSPAQMRTYRQSVTSWGTELSVSKLSCSSSCSCIGTWFLNQVFIMEVRSCSI